MIGNNCLLDTSIVIHTFKGNTAVVEQLDSLENVFISTTAIGELYFGAFKSDNPQKHLQQVGAFITNCKILSVDTETAKVYGNIKTLLAKKGKPIPENDIWIAAVAIQHNLPLFSTDNHFKEIDSLILF